MLQIYGEFMSLANVSVKSAIFARSNLSCKMRSSSIFKEYVWLLTTIKDAGQISFGEIADRWRRASINESGQPMARTTFNRHRLAIEEIFDVEILCNRSAGNKYYIDESAQLGSQEIARWMCDSLTVGTLMADFKSLSRRISLEPVPTADAKLRLILQAMEQNAVVEMTYQRVGEDPQPVSVEPFAVKLFKQRWYMLGRAEGGEGLRLFSLERIEEPTITERRFQLPDDFSAHDYFADIYGVMSAHRDAPVERVVLRAYGRDRLYLEDLPMHPSQRKIADELTHTDFELRLKPTPDFAAAILSRGGWVKVLEPQWFAEDLLRRADFTVASFEEDF